jgi:hypothetical protein
VSADHERPALLQAFQFSTPPDLTPNTSPASQRGQGPMARGCGLLRTGPKGGAASERINVTVPRKYLMNCPAAIYQERHPGDHTCGR